MARWWWIAGALLVCALAPHAASDAIVSQGTVRLGVTNLGTVGTEGAIATDCGGLLTSLLESASSIDAMDCDTEGDGWGVTYGATDATPDDWGVGYFFQGPPAWYGSAYGAGAGSHGQAFVTHAIVGDVTVDQTFSPSSRSNRIVQDLVNVTYLDRPKMGLIEFRRCMAWKDPATQQDISANDLQLVGAPLPPTSPLVFSAIVYGGCQLTPGAPFCPSLDPVVAACRGAFWSKPVAGDGRMVPSTLPGPPAQNQAIDEFDDGIEWDFAFANVSQNERLQMTFYFGAAPDGGTAIQAVHAVGADVMALDASPSALPAASAPKDWSTVPGLTFIQAVGPTARLQMPLPNPAAGFDAQALMTCHSDQFRFTDHSSPVARGSRLVAWHWDFGDGNTSDVQYPGPHAYLRPGEYLVTLTVTDDNGHQGSAFQRVQADNRYCPLTLDPNSDIIMGIGQRITVCWWAHDAAAPLSSLTWTVHNLPNATMVFQQDTHCLTWTTSRGDLGYHPGITVTVCDAAMCATQVFAIDVVEHPPQPGPVDSDRDGISDEKDNCPAVPNHDQRDSNGDGVGDACDPTPCHRDSLVGVPPADPATIRCAPTPCPRQDLYGFTYWVTCAASRAVVAASKEPDRDQDGIPDAQDNCPSVPNPEQADLDADGIGDACDVDMDGDGINDKLAAGDSPLTLLDNCPTVPNPDQRDANHDGVGDACETLQARAPAPRPLPLVAQVEPASPVGAMAAVGGTTALILGAAGAAFLLVYRRR
ncbi:MAG: thrombospondin type 3 repeat-containing protein [Thermoplasmatota archaeon]